MRRSLVILLVALAAAAAIFAGSYFAANRVCTEQMCNPADDLAWLRQEFQLNDADMARIRQLHAGYLPKCGEMCARIEAKMKEVEGALAGATNVTADAQQKLMELGELRAACQAQMLQHFAEVSQAMPPAQGGRYLAEMQRLTLGFHQQIENAMSGSADHGQRHH